MGLSSKNVYGGTDLQSLHVSPHLCVTPRLHPLLHPLHTYCRVLAPVRLYHMKMSIYVIIHQVNSFFGFYLPVEIYILAIQSSENDDPIL